MRRSPGVYAWMSDLVYWLCFCCDSVNNSDDNNRVGLITKQVGLQGSQRTRTYGRSLLDGGPCYEH